MILTLVTMNYEISIVSNFDIIKTLFKAKITHDIYHYHEIKLLIS